tara:strand:+ start:250 stop:645 length:396 start_codon:yes stop_codon:yes gene_type:complete
MPLDLKKDSMGDVIKDFYKSKAPQFKGRSKEKRREMAIAAKLTAERGPQTEALRTSILSSPKAMKRVSDNDEKNKEQDKRMKFGKFAQKAKEAQSKLRKGEVKTWDPDKKQYVSNKDNKPRYNELTGKKKT